MSEPAPVRVLHPSPDRATALAEPLGDAATVASLATLHEDAAEVSLLLAAPAALGDAPSATLRELAEAAPELGVLLVVGADDAADAEPLAEADPVVGLLDEDATPARLRAQVRAARAVRDRLAARRRDARQAREEQETFVGLVHHDLKTPLQGMLGLAGLLRRRAGEELSGEARRWCAQIERDGQRMDRMIEALASYARMGRRRWSPQPVALGRLVEEATASAIHRHPERIPRLQPASELPELEGDPELLRLVVDHLVDNALVHNDASRPEVTVSWAPHAAPRPGGVLVVRDNGPGLAPEARSEVFELFDRGPRRHDAERVGAGLALVRRAAAQLGGHVWLESADGRDPASGLAACVDLPLSTGT